MVLIKLLNLLSDSFLSVQHLRAISDSFYSQYRELGVENITTLKYLILSVNTVSK